MSSHILIVEDDLTLQSYLKDLLHENDYFVRAVKDGIAALQLIKKTPPDLVILDLGLPLMDGKAVCQEIKKKHPELPVIVLTGQTDINVVISTLNLGADDYITKPFNAEELLARIKARLRMQNKEQEEIKVGDLSINNKTLEVIRGPKVMRLTPREFKLLEYLMTHKGQVLSRDMILNRIWLYAPEVDTRIVDIYIGYLRKKIDADFDKKLIHSVRGFGYMLKE